MKARGLTTMDAPLRALVMRTTNLLLQNGLAIKIAKDIFACIQEIQNFPALPRGRRELLIRVAKKLSECLFFALYQTQITAEEDDAISQCLRIYSVISPNNTSFASVQVGSPRIENTNHGLGAMYNVVCALQLSQVRR